MSKAGQRAYEMIRMRILSGAMRPGTQLKEEEIAELCGVSRTPVRDAMNRLEAEMFIQRTDSKRSFVSSWSGEDVDELFTLRAMLEGHAASRAAVRISAAQLDALAASNEAVAIAIARAEPDVDEFLRQNSIFHELVIGAAASDRLAGMINRLVLRPIVHRTALRYDRAQLDRSLAEHVETVAALRHRDPGWAAAVMTAHIRRAFHIYVSGRQGDAD